MKLISDGKPIYFVGNKHRKYRLTTDWQIKQGFGTWVVPKGFRTDLASIPPIFFWWRHGAWDIAAIAHDFIYEKGYIFLDDEEYLVIDIKFSRKGADLFFYDCCLGLGVNRVTAKLMYLAVRLFGGRYWRHD